MLEAGTKDVILSLFEKRKFATVKELLLEYNEVDIAELLESLDEDIAVKIFRLIHKEQAAEVFAAMEHDLQEKIVTSMTDRELHKILDELFLDDTVDLLEEMPANVVNRILKHTDANTRKAINQLLRYPDDSAGSLMNTEFIELKKEMTVRGALMHIKKVGDMVEDISDFYVTDKNRILEGYLSLKDIILADDDVLIEELMDTALIYVNTLDDKEEVASKFTKYGLVAMPVVDNETRLVGIITFDDAVEVIEEEVTEDFEIMAAVTPLEDSYMKTGVLRQFVNRIPWLLLLMLTATITGAIIDSFEQKLATIVGLIAFIPMLMNTGGNCGSQASIQVIRSLALGDIKGYDVLTVWWKEIRVGFLCGLSLALVNFIYVFLTKTWLTDLAQFEIIQLALAVSTSLFVTTVVAKSIGCLLPIGAKKLGFDPAIMAAPFITTIVDSISLLVYFSCAQIIFKL